jgi:hypothetical protein
MAYAQLATQPLRGQPQARQRLDRHDVCTEAADVTGHHVEGAGFDEDPQALTRGWHISAGERTEDEDAGVG